jgi:tRNA G18 (ribose-2'-O)-methylase SpoU
VIVHVEAADDPRLADYRGVRHRSRESDNFFIVETQLAVERLVASPYPIRSVLVSTRRVDAVVPLLAGIDVPLFVLPQDAMSDVVGFDIHRGVLASAERLPGRELVDVLPTARRVLVIEGCNDHANLGAMARSARGLGIDAMLLDPTCADPLYRRSVRVSMGEMLRMTVVRCGLLAPVLQVLHESGFDTWALTPSHDAQSIWELSVPERVAIVVGAEGPGLRDTTMQAARRLVRIPMHHGVDSLNVGYAAAVAMAALDR